MAEDMVWKLQQGPQKEGYNISVFEPGYVMRAAGVRETPAAMTPLLHDPDYCEQPLYMWKEREPETFSDDEDEEKKEKEKIGVFDRPKPKGARSKTRRVQWHMEDARPPPGNMRFIGNRKEQQSKYVLFEVQDTEEDAIIKVIPVDEWWRFERPAANEGKMTVKEAMEKMRQQQRGYAVGSHNKALEASLSKSEEARFGDADDAALELDGGSGRKKSSAGGGKAASARARAKSPIADEGGQEGEKEAEGGAAGAKSDAEAASEHEEEGEDAEKGIDFDQVFSDDEADIADTANADVGLESSEDEEEVKDGEVPGQNLLNKALAGGGDEAEEAEEEEDDYTVSGAFRARMAGRVSPVPSETDSVALAGAASIGGGSAAPTPADTPEAPGGRKRAAVDVGGAVEAKRPRPAPAGGPLALNQENMIAVLRRNGGQMTSKKLLAAFKHELKNSKPSQALFKQLINVLVQGVDDAIEGKVYKLRDIWMP